MIGKGTRLLLLAIAVMGSPRKATLGPDVLLPRALARIHSTTGKGCALPDHFPLLTLRFSADSRTLFIFSARCRCRWDVSRKKPALIEHIRRKARESGCLARSDDDRLFLDRCERLFRLRDTATGNILNGLYCDATTDLVQCWFSPDSTRIFSWFSDDKAKSRWTLLFYDSLKTGRIIVAIDCVDAASKPVFSPNGRLIAWADRSGAIRLHDSVTGKAVRMLRSTLPLPKAIFRTAELLFIGDEQLLIVPTNSNPDAETLPARVYRVSDGRESRRFYAHPEKTNNTSRSSCLACSPDRRLLAIGEHGSGIVRLIEISSGKVRIEFAGHRHGVHGLAFSPDGKLLASGGEDNIVFLWDVIGTQTPTDAKSSHPMDLEACWNDLASEDGSRAGLAITSLLHKPKASIAFLQDQLRPTEDVDKTRLALLLADLDSDTYRTRQTANRAPIPLGELAEAALRRALTNHPSLELRRRIEDVLERIELGPPPPETLRELRAIEALEHIGTPEARRCLKALAKGAPKARQTREAKEARERMAKHRGTDASARRR